MTKLCECGCGSPTPNAKVTNKSKGIFAGTPLRFVPGHQNRGRRWSDEHRAKFSAKMKGHPVTAKTRRKISQQHKAKGIRPSPEAAAKGNSNRKGEKSPTWKGGVITTNGRRCIYMPDHPRAHKNGYVYEHILVAERTLGRPIQPGEVVHHIDRNVLNNAPENLEVLPSQAEHMRRHKEEGDLL